MVLEEIQEEKPSPVAYRDQSKISDLQKLSKNDIAPFLRPPFTPAALNSNIVFLRSDEDSNSIYREESKVDGYASNNFISPISNPEGEKNPFKAKGKIILPSLKGNPSVRGKPSFMPAFRVESVSPVDALVDN
jgi:hypothetical protein